jgi:H+/Cl- antiporter ClcA
MFFKERRTGAYLVIILSTLVAVIAIAMIIMTCVFNQSLSFLNGNNSEYNVPNNWKVFAVVILLLFSSTALIVGLTGLFCLCKPCIKHRGWVIPFGISIMFSWVIFSIMGFIIAAFSTNGPETVQAFCDR